MKLNLTESEKDELIPKICRVIETGESWSAESMHHPVEALVGAILDIPGVERQPLRDSQYGIEGFETNGWQWDWCQDFKHEGNRYTLVGSGYYGGHAFFLSDEQDKD